MADFLGEKMVGVARIELATPAMSTQSHGQKPAKKRCFPFRTDRNGPETSQQHCGLLPQFYRTVTA